MNKLSFGSKPWAWTSNECSKLLEAVISIHRNRLIQFDYFYQVLQSKAKEKYGLIGIQMSKLASILFENLYNRSQSSGQVPHPKSCRNDFKRTNSLDSTSSMKGNCKSRQSIQNSSKSSQNCCFREEEEKKRFWKRAVLDLYTW